MSEQVDTAPALSYSAEMKRKALHLGALAMPIGILIVESPIDVLVLSTLAILTVSADVARVRSPGFKRLVEAIFRPIMRPRELPPVGGPVVLNGATWMFVSAALCALLFPSGIAAAVLAMTMVGDAAAAAVGMRVGRNKYPWSDKTLEGSLAFAVAGLLVAMPFAVLAAPPIGPGPLLIAAVAAAATETSPLPINDNVKVPVVAGAILLLLV